MNIIKCIDPYQTQYPCKALLVDTIVVSVMRDDGTGTDVEVIPETTLVKIGNVWRGVLSRISIGTEVTISAIAYSVDSQVLYTGSWKSGEEHSRYTAGEAPDVKHGGGGVGWGSCNKSPPR
jgi:hypothetical protein